MDDASGSVADSGGAPEGGDEPDRSEYLVILSVVLSVFFLGFSGGVIFPILPNLGAVLGISPFVVGLILGINRFARILSNVPAGLVTDRIGTRTPFVGGLVIQAIGTFGYVIGYSAPRPGVWFLASRLTIGIGGGFMFATVFTIAGDLSGSDSRGRVMGLLRGGLFSGLPVGLVIGGLVADVADGVAGLPGNLVALLLASGFSVVAVALAYVTVPETHVDDERTGPVGVRTVDRSLTTVTIGFVNFAVQFAYVGVLFATLVQYLRTADIGAFGLSAQGSSGVFIAVTFLVGSVCMFSGGYLSDIRASRLPTLFAFICSLSAGFAVLVVSESVGLVALACVLIGVGEGGIDGPLSALLADLTPDDRLGRASGTNNVLTDLGAGIGPVVAVPLVEDVGFGPLYATSALLPFLAGGLLLAGLRYETGACLPNTADIDIS